MTTVMVLNIKTMAFTLGGSKTITTTATEEEIKD
jgi:hypothetical protein